MTRGITKPCPECRKGQPVRYAQIQEQVLVTEQHRCSGCQCLLEVKYKLEPKIIVKKILPAVIFLLILAGAFFITLKKSSPENYATEKLDTYSIDAILK